MSYFVPSVPERIPLKILLVSQYFSPESFIINDLVRYLSALGHHIIVLTGKPNYPQGSIYEGYQLWGIQRERYTEAIEVIRIPLLPRGKGGIRLAANYLSFVMSGLLCFPWLMRGKSVDAILVFAISPVTQAIPAIALKWLKGAHLAIWIQDLWPESVRATGYITNSLLLRMIGWIVKSIYTRSDTLLVQSRAFTQPVARYAREDKIVYYPNSFEDKNETIADNASQVSTPLLEQLDAHFCVVFAGNLGTAQALDTLLRAAERLRHLPDLKLVIVGNGSMQSWLARQQIEKSLDNVLLAGRFPPEAMGPIFSRAKGLLVTLKRDEIFSFVIPSKIQSYLAAGRPIIAALDGEGAKIVEEAGAGLTCPAEDAEALAVCIEKLHKMSETEREALGHAGRTYFLQNFEMAAQAQRLIEIFNIRMKETQK